PVPASSGRSCQPNQKHPTRIAKTGKMNSLARHMRYNGGRIPAKGWQATRRSKIVEKRAPSPSRRAHRGPRQARFWLDGVEQLGSCRCQTERIEYAHATREASGDSGTTPCPLWPGARQLE